MLQKSHDSSGISTDLPWMPASTIPNWYLLNETPLYICNKVDRTYFSRKGCMDTNIIPKSFPFKMNTTDRSASVASVESVEDQQSPWLQSPPPRPNHLPFPTTTENIPKLEQFIRDQFPSSPFNKYTLFPTISTTPAHIT